MTPRAPPPAPPCAAPPPPLPPAPLPHPTPTQVFSGYTEAPISFPPTFTMRRVPGFVYGDKRTASYCDRILWRSLPALAADVVCERYEAHGAVSSSDHKPVSAAFRVEAHWPRGAAAAPAAAAALPRLHFGRLAGHGLLAADLTGFSDPYVLFYSDPPGLLQAAAPDDVAAAAARGSSSSVSSAGSAAAGVGGGRRGLSVLASSLRSLASGSVHSLFNAETTAPRTGFKSQTLDPVWEARELPELLLLLRGAAGAGSGAGAGAGADAGANAGEAEAELRHAHLIFVLMDRDLASDDRLGHAVLPLRGLAAAAAAAAATRRSGLVPFSLPVTRNGVRFGSISGTLELRLPDTPRLDGAPRRHFAMMQLPSFREVLGGGGGGGRRALQPRRTASSKLLGGGGGGGGGGDKARGEGSTCGRCLAECSIQ